jgi:hypothetical protein
LHSQRKSPLTELDEGARAARIEKTFPAQQATEDNVVEEVLTGEMHGGKALCCRYEDWLHRGESTFKLAAVVVEQARTHVGRGDDDIEAGLTQVAQHGQRFLGRSGAVVDIGYPVAVKVDETSHRGTVGLASMHPSPRYERHSEYGD